MRYLILILLAAACTQAIAPTITPDPTPTLEIGCVPGSYAKVWEETRLYRDSRFTHPELHTEWVAGKIYTEVVVIEQYDDVILLYDRTPTARMVITTEGWWETGWIPVSVLADECQ